MLSVTDGSRESGGDEITMPLCKDRVLLNIAHIRRFNPVAESQPERLPVSGIG